ncbi:heterokaryon incompatibility protein-domain-containing protein [Alternaria rosae]|uniref:heterokaryon incompatibility protein-domain-containing protein n=1 Tax=Alternaria rosae TaxID=1187941 RepID=UPI001E8DB3C5|nr:heterokaryon incompatibility protein-domain-containing protein [Alternaria rosae]KAH6860661.1 heterokaryon incompatibility protein-domain-containing protein [Alternaria rosae]
MATIEPDPRSPVSPYESKALANNEIRLLKIAYIDGIIQLKSRRHVLAQDLDYDAISYVWGSAPATETVLYNGKPLIITPTALEMLHYLHGYQRNTKKRRIWIDAICINQDDKKEKSNQISLMRDIYAWTTTVIVWMGPSTFETDVFFAGFPDVKKKGEWFRRLWTYQEIILPPRATLLCGGSWADFDEFVDFVTEGFHRSTYIGKLSNIGRDARTSTANVTCISIHFYRSLTSQQGWGTVIHSQNVAINLYSLRYRHVKEPVDRVWAIVGLLETDFRDAMTSKVDYSERGRFEYWKTWIMFTKALMDTPGGMRLLQIPPTLGPRSSYLPSWCPDLSGASACHMVIDGQWNNTTERQYAINRWALCEENSEIERAKVTARAWEIQCHDETFIGTVRHDDLLRIRGFVLDTIEEVVEHTKILDFAYERYDRDSEEHTLLYDIAVGHLMQCLSLARRVFYGKSEGVADIPDDFLMIHFADCSIGAKARNVYCEMLSKLMTWYSPSRFQPTWEQKQCHQRWVYRRGHTFFSTKGGRIGFAHPGCKPGDHVATFYSGQPLYILRQLTPTKYDIDSTGQASDHVQYMGAAFIPHLMEQYQRDAARRGPVTTFVIH